MTPATRALRAADLAFIVREYERDGDELHDFGREAADALGLSYDEVFKTLIVTIDAGELIVAVIPVSCRLSLKAVAAAAGAKRATMSDPAAAERSSGYVLGGISPIGQRKQLRTIVDDSATLFEMIYVSGGRRGLDIGLAPTDLMTLLDATVASITA